nr:immunoglobulin light chain junction region [Macaca mulatta]MOX23822.1 immunoglobulin light chain junction region [Macaca mulatta]MOX23995.1 immunoglobulin light chain junction region [Macaca mulatta]MOX24008.1 immunoglobulin light chain junction region [Macaca mulatta]MOX24209.1 immunoglobulin light chain junction region [Macaca mulatta]
CQHYNSLPYNF